MAGTEYRAQKAQPAVVSRKQRGESKTRGKSTGVTWLSLTRSQVGVAFAGGRVEEGWEAVVGNLGACVIRMDTDMAKRPSAALGCPCRCKVFPAFLSGLGKGSGRSVPSFPNGQCRLPKRSSNSLTLYTAQRILSSPIRREGIYHFYRPLAGQREPLCQSGQRQTGRYPKPERNRAHGKQKWRELGTVRKCAEQNFLTVLL